MIKLKQFKFHYVQMKLWKLCSYYSLWTQMFKFNYVQMKLKFDYEAESNKIKFKFHYVQMKQMLVALVWRIMHGLNSTMFRWNDLYEIQHISDKGGLNSTMFRWNFWNWHKERIFPYGFKFHYVQMKQITCRTASISSIAFV